jgi:hypothetical protein
MSTFNRPFTPGHLFIRDAPSRASLSLFTLSKSADSHSGREQRYALRVKALMKAIHFTHFTHESIYFVYTAISRNYLRKFLISVAPLCVKSYHDLLHDLWNFHFIRSNSSLLFIY